MPSQWRMSPPRRWPLDPASQVSAPVPTGAHCWKETPYDPYHHQPPAHGGDLRPSTVRARSWHGEGDVRGYRPPSGWTARADLTDIHPITGRALARRVVDHRDEGITAFSTAPRSFRPGRGGRARQWPRPVRMLHGAIKTLTLSSSCSAFRSFSIPRGLWIRPSGSYTKQKSVRQFGCLLYFAISTMSCSPNSLAPSPGRDFLISTTASISGSKKSILDAPPA